MRPRNAVTIRLDRDLIKKLDGVCKRSGRTRSAVVRDAIRKQLSPLQFDRLRLQVMPFAEARGFLTEEDILKESS